MSSLDIPTAPSPHAIAQRLNWVITTLQWAALCYVVWMLWLITAPLRDPAELLGWLSRLWHRPLDHVQPWQLQVYTGIDALDWALIALAAWYGWQAMQHVKQPAGQDRQATQQLTRGAWLVLAAEVFSIVARPVKSYVMTWGYSASAPMTHWFLNPQDLLVLMFCLTLLGLAYVFSWKAYLAEENRGFV